MLLSLLLHQVFLTLMGAVWTVPKLDEEKPREVMLLKEPLPEPLSEKTPKKEKPQLKRKPLPRPPRLSPMRQKQIAPDKEPTPLEPPPELAGPPPTAPEPTPPAKPNINLNLDWNNFERTFSQNAAHERHAYTEKSLEQRRTRGSFKSRLTGKVKKALGSNRGWVRPGNQEPLGPRKVVFHNYIDLVHERLHTIFANRFLASLSSLDPKDPLNDFNLRATLEFEIFANGQLSEVRVVRSSGNSVFDASAVDSMYRSGPYRPPPKSILSWNDRVYMRWGFYRNHRMCGVFNAEPYILKAPGAKPEPIPEDKFIIKDG